MNPLFCAVTAALMLAAPAFASPEPARFRGALLNADTPLRIQNAAVYWSEGGPGATPVEQMTREQLQAEYQRLDSERPGLGGSIALTAVGGVMLLVGLGIGAAGLSTLLYSEGSQTLAALGFVMLGLGTVMVITGAILLTVGLVKLFARIGERRGYSQRMEDINARLESLDRTGTPAPPPPAELPPPPPGASRFDVPPGLVVAVF